MSDDWNFNGRQFGWGVQEGLGGLSLASKESPLHVIVRQSETQLVAQMAAVLAAGPLERQHDSSPDEVMGDAVACARRILALAKDSGCGAQKPSGESDAK